MCSSDLAAGKLYAAGAHYVVDTLADLPGVIADIEANLPKGFPDPVARPMLHGLGQAAMQLAAG